MVVLAVLTLTLAACGGKTENTTDAGVDGDAFDAKPLSNLCPASAPADGASCSKEGLKCEYGSDPRWTCNTIAACSAGHWSVGTTNDAWCPTPNPNAQACPATYSDANQHGACNDMGTPCHYTEGWCACMWLGGPPMQDASMQATWQCTFDVTPGCPATRPWLGTSCNTPNQECDYGLCGAPTGLSVTCDQTTMTWVDGFGAPCGGAN